MRFHLVLAFGILALPACAFAQTGTPPFASFSQNQFSAINNGNLNNIFTIPAMSSPGRGLSLNVSAIYNSQVWVPQANGGGALAWPRSEDGYLFLQMIKYSKN